MWVLSEFGVEQDEGGCVFERGAGEVEVGFFDFGEFLSVSCAARDVWPDGSTAIFAAR